MTIEGVEVRLRDKDAPVFGEHAEVALFLEEEGAGKYRLVSDVSN